MKDLTESPRNLIDQYAFKNAELKKVQEELKLIRHQLDKALDIANQFHANTLIFETDQFKATYSAVTQNKKLNTDIKQFLTETNAYDVVTVSITEARKVLTTEQIEKYFTDEPGSRTLKVVMRGDL